MAIVITKQSMKNMEYVRTPLKQKQPGFARSLELAGDLANPDPKLGEAGWTPIAGFACQIMIDRAPLTCSAMHTLWAD